MPTFALTRRAALLSFGGFAAAGLGGCNTTPSAGVQPAAASGLGIGAIEVDTTPLVAYVGNPTAGWAQQALPGALAQVLGSGAPGGPSASRSHRHALSGRGRPRRSRPDERRRDAGRPHDKRPGDIDKLRSEPDRSGAAGAGFAGPGPGPRGGLRLPAEEQARRLSGCRQFFAINRNLRYGEGCRATGVAIRGFGRRPLVG